MVTPFATVTYTGTIGASIFGGLTEMAKSTQEKLGDDMHVLNQLLGRHGVVNILHGAALHYANTVASAHSERMVAEASDILIALVLCKKQIGDVML